jgi:hypothetical protein
VDEEVFFLIQCGECATLFSVCAGDYAGQGLCGEACRKASLRRARMEHQRSPEGRDDHRDRNREYRIRRRKRGRVMDVRSNSLAVEAESCVREAGVASMEDATTSVAESKHDDAGTTDGDAGSEADGDADPGDGGTGRAAPSSAGAGTRDASESGGDASGGVCSLAPDAARRCIVCRRLGDVFRPCTCTTPSARESGTCISTWQSSPDGGPAAPSCCPAPRSGLSRGGGFFMGWCERLRAPGRVCLTDCCNAAKRREIGSGGR